MQTKEARWPTSRLSERHLSTPTIASHRGRIVKTTGDGMLVEFASAVDAVRSAVEIQRSMAEQNSGVAQDQRIELRIGIHVGDIIFDDNDIFGDGVNIALRGWKALPRRAAYAYPMTPIGKSGARWKSSATTLGRRPSRTLPS